MSNIPPPPPPAPSAPQPPPAQPPQGMSGRQAFKIGCMITLGVICAIGLVFCAVPAACVMGTAGVAATAVAEAEKNRAESAPTNRPELEQNAEQSIVTEENLIDSPPVSTGAKQVVSNAQQITSETLAAASATYAKATEAGVIVRFSPEYKFVLVNASLWTALDKEQQSGLSNAIDVLYRSENTEQYVVVSYPDGKIVASGKRRNSTDEKFGELVVTAVNKQMQMAQAWKGHVDYWTSETEVLQRHKKEVDLANAQIKQQEAIQSYKVAVSEQNFSTLLEQEVAEEARKVAAREKAAREAPAREKARRDAEQFNAYMDEYMRKVDIDRHFR